MCLIIIFPVFAYGDSSEGKIGVGLNYPGMSVRYFLSDITSLELKGQYEQDILVLGSRFYYYFDCKSEVLLFGGIEGDYVSFKGEESQGNGFACELFVGLEYFFTKKLSFQMDIGPAWIYLADRNYTSVTVAGFEYVVNLGFNYYF